MMHLQLKYWRHHLARSTLWYRTMRMGAGVLQSHRWLLRRWNSTLHPECGAVGANPSHPIRCPCHSVLLRCDREHCPLDCEPVAGWFSFSPDTFERWMLRWARARWDAGRQMMSWEQQGKGSDSKGGSWHTCWSRCTLPGTVQTKQRNGIKRLFPFRQNKVKKKAVHNSTLQFFVAETIFLSRVC